MIKLLSITVQGKSKAWSFNFIGDDRYMDDWRADGLVIDEVIAEIDIDRAMNEAKKEAGA